MAIDPGLMTVKEDFFRRKEAQESARREAISSSLRNKLKDPLTIFTFLLVLVAALQWRTLEKTDATLRAGQRAFVFLDGIQMTQHPIQPQGYIWYFTASIQNNGATQTKDLVHRLACKKAPSNSEIQSAHSVLGPKQIDGAGACFWPADQLARIWQTQEHIFMMGDATYYDVFGDYHVTRFCRDILVESDPRVGTGIMQQVTATCPERPDCTDKECEKSVSNLPPPEGPQN
jgi:hypothetical protein